MASVPQTPTNPGARLGSKRVNLPVGNKNGMSFPFGQIARLKSIIFGPIACHRRASPKSSFAVLRTVPLLKHSSQKGASADKIVCLAILWLLVITDSRTAVHGTCPS